MNSITKYSGIFHVHTYRCGHAENVSDEEYIKKAMQLSAKDIWFTDHSPFPGDPFGNRMKYGQLDEYISTLSSLKSKYKDIINVHIGLEIEYFPSFEEYYKNLLSDERIELLLLGQHIYELSEGTYNFSLPREEKEEYEMEGITDAMVRGMETGYFSVCAHPDRVFRYRKTWGDSERKCAEKIIRAAYRNDVILEKNIALQREGLYREEFWHMTDHTKPVVIGVDAHSVNEVDCFTPTILMN